MESLVVKSLQSNINSTKEFYAFCITKRIDPKTVFSKQYASDSMNEFVEFFNRNFNLKLTFEKQAFKAFKGEHCCISVNTSESHSETFSIFIATLFAFCEKPF